MGRKIINMRVGDEVTYLHQKYVVVDVYSYIAYLKNVMTEEVECLGLGELVMSGLQPSAVSSRIVTNH